MSPGDNHPVLRPFASYHSHQRQLSRLVKTERQEEGSFILGWCAVGCALLLAALLVTR